MSNTTKIILAIIITAIIGGGAWALLGTKKPDNQNQTQDAPARANNSSSPEEESNVGAVIVYNQDGFSPATFTVKSGQKIKILNETDEMIEFASDPHPTHTINPELNSDDIEGGEVKEVTATKKGEWGFHNHFNPSKRGVVTVE